MLKKTLLTKIRELKKIPSKSLKKVDEDTQEVAEILASKMMSGENAQSEEDKQMEYSTGFCSQHRTSKLRLQH